MKDGQVEPRYTITHKDGKPIPPSNKIRFFVLDIENDPYAVSALCHYARICRLTHPKLSQSILETFTLPCAFASGETPQWSELRRSQSLRDLEEFGPAFRTKLLEGDFTLANEFAPHTMCVCGHPKEQHHVGDGIDTCDCGACQACRCNGFKAQKRKR